MTFRKESGGTEVSRRDEARRIVNMLANDFESMTCKDANFYADMQDRLEDDNFYPSSGQLFWLRDIHSRILEG